MALVVIIQAMFQFDSTRTDGILTCVLHKVKTLLLAALGVVGTTAQLTNSTLLSILNTTQLSPSPKFIQLLQSSPDYQPVLELLSQPGNITLFVPSDAVFDRLIEEFQQTQQTQGGGSNGSSSGGSGGESSGTGGGTTGGTGGGTNGGTAGETGGGTGGGTNGGTAGETGGGTGSGTNGGTSGTSGSIVGRAINDPAGGDTNGTIPGSGDGSDASNSTAGGGTSSTPSVSQSSSITSSTSNPSPTGGGSSNGTTGGGTGSSSGNSTQPSSQQNVFPQGFSIFSNFTVLDILYYHILQEKVMLQNQTNQTVILNSMLTNQTANKFGYGMPIILNSNTTQQNSSSSSSGTESGGGNGTSSGGNGTSPSTGGTSGGNGTSPSTGGASGDNSTSPAPGGVGNSTSSGDDTGFAPQAASWISRIKQLIDAQSSSGGSNPSQSGSNSTETPVYWIGNGLANANITLYDIEASNGVLHVIDDVLIPPGNASNVFANISDASSLSEMIDENPEVSQALNNASNVTIFAPNDKSLCMVCIDQLGQDKWKGLVMNHVVEGIYYTTNLTSSGAGSSPMSLTTEAGENLPVSSNSTGITLNNTIQIVTPNILFNGGVIHLIDKIIEPPQNSTVSNNGTAAGPSQSSSSSAAAPVAASSTSVAQPSPSASSMTAAQPAAQSNPPESSPSDNPVGVEQPSPPEDPPPKPAFDNPFPPTYF